MSVLCIILARGGSKGIPKKNIFLIAGKPLVDWSILVAKQSGIFDEIILSSDDENILDRARALNITALKRPNEISGDHSSSEEALLHAVKSTNLNQITEVVFLQPTSPLRMPADLIAGLKHFRENHLDSLFSSVPVHDRFVWESRDGHFDSMTYDWKDRKRRQEITEKFLENGSFYIFKPKILLETNNRLGGKIGTFLMDKWKGTQIDSPADIELAELFLESRLKKEWNP
jgi:CMP-N,N'-diacetyllegionaminic acid synthase